MREAHGTTDRAEQRSRASAAEIEQQAASRRDFIKQASLMAGAAAALSVGTPAARARVPEGRPGQAATPPGETDTIRLGVIGVGGMGRGHCRAMTRFQQRGETAVEVVAVADVSDHHAEQAVREIGEAGQKASVESYRDYRDLLARQDIHAVMIASPEHWHAKHAIDAIMAGKDVYCEKPMTFGFDDGLALRDVLRVNTDKIFVVGTQGITLPKYKEARRLIENGEIGKPVFSQTSYCRNNPHGEWTYYRINPEWQPGVNLDWEGWLGHLRQREWDPKIFARWRRYSEYSTGIIGDLLVHEMTPMMYTLDSMGWPTRVVASGGHYVDVTMDNHDQVNINVEFEHGHTMIVAGSTSNEIGLENLIRGHEANIYLNSRHCVVRPSQPFADVSEPFTIECPDIGNNQDQLRREWLTAIRTRQQPESTVELGLKVMAVVDMAARSIRDGHAYTFDPAAMAIRRV